MEKVNALLRAECYMNLSQRKILMKPLIFSQNGKNHLEKRHNARLVRYGTETISCLCPKN